MTNITNEIKIESAVNVIPFEPESKQITFIDSFKRFNEAAEILNSKTIGIQIEINRKITQVTAFSDSKIDLDDYKWILGENMKASSISRENFELHSERFCYAVIQNQQSAYSGRYTDASLLSVLQENGIVLQLYFTASNGEANTIMLLYSPIELPLRTQIMLSRAFDGSKIKNITRDDEIGNIDSKGAVAGFEVFLNMAANQMHIKREKTNYDDTLIEELDFSVRTYNCLKRYGVTTLKELKTISDDELSKIRNLGRKGVEEIQDKLLECSMEEYIPLERDDEFDDIDFDGIDDDEIFDGDEILLEDEPEKKIKKSGVEKLNELIGLSRAKEQVKRIVALAKLQQDMKDNNKNTIPITLNMQFAGNPGTAKTTVARIMAQILFEAGLIKNKDIIEVGRADLVAKYVGQTADKVKNLFSNAKGRLLFIDEAYSLVDEWENSYGDEAINTIVQEMENNRDDIIVIFAGYPKKMEEFFNRNVGLKSRVPFCIKFDDYSTDEMIQISKLEADRRGFTICDDAIEKLKNIYADAQNDTQSGNGRCCRNVIENAIMSYAARVYGDDADVNKNYVLTDDDFIYVEKPKVKEDVRRIGFQS